MDKGGQRWIKVDKGGEGTEQFSSEAPFRASWGECLAGGVCAAVVILCTLHCHCVLHCVSKISAAAELEGPF